MLARIGQAGSGSRPQARRVWGNPFDETAAVAVTITRHSTWGCSSKPGSGSRRTGRSTRARRYRLSRLKRLVLRRTGVGFVGGAFVCDGDEHVCECGWSRQGRKMTARKLDEVRLEPGASDPPRPRWTDHPVVVADHRGFSQHHAPHQEPCTRANVVTRRSQESYAPIGQIGMKVDL